MSHERPPPKPFAPRATETSLAPSRTPSPLSAPPRRERAPSCQHGLWEPADGYGVTRLK